jgi:hypothetical protein
LAELAWQEAAVQGVVLAAVNPDNTPHGYNWTFAFPMLLFIVIALILYALYSRPHRRVPSRPIRAGSAGGRAPATQTGGATLAASANPADAPEAQTTPQEPGDSAEASE